MMIASTLKPSDVDKPTEQVSSCFSSGDLENTSSLWLTGKNENNAMNCLIIFDMISVYGP